MNKTIATDTDIHRYRHNRAYNPNTRTIHLGGKMTKSMAAVPGSLVGAVSTVCMQGVCKVVRVRLVRVVET